MTNSIDKPFYIKLSHNLLSITLLGLIIYLNFKDVTYIKNLSEAFLFGGNPSIAQYSFGLFIEGITSVLIVSFINIQYWKTKNVFNDVVES